MEKWREDYVSEYVNYPNYIIGSGDAIIDWSEVGIFIHLHYVDTLDKYMEKIENMQNYCHVYISTNSMEIKDVLQNKYGRYENISIFEKPNRGRDVSALLVTFREEIKRYRYFCFLHDKKAKNSYEKESMNLWIDNLWDNMISSPEYVKNIIKLFQEDSCLGLLVPPEPIGGCFSYEYSWNENYKNTEELARKLHLSVEISKGCPPITYGTAFWGKKEYFQNLFAISWKYDDFPEEPLAIDGTISHAVERILGYVVLDAGGKIGRSMTNEYAQRYLSYMQEATFLTFQMLDWEYNFLSLNDVERYKAFICSEWKITEENDIYIYGAGVRGQKCLCILQKRGWEPVGFIVSEISDTQKECMGYPIFRLEDINRSSTIVVAVSEKFKLEIETRLRRKGYTNYLVF